MLGVMLGVMLGLTLGMMVGIANGPAITFPLFMRVSEDLC